MNYKQVTKKLRALGCHFDEQGRGSHETWRNPATQKRATIPNWRSTDLKPGTLRKILRDLEIDKRDFDQA